MNITYDKYRHDNTEYAVKEMVVMTSVPLQTEELTKLQVYYRGPLVVTEKLSKIYTMWLKIIKNNIRQQNIFPS